MVSPSPPEAEPWTDCLSSSKRSLYSSLQDVRRLLEEKANPNCRLRYKLGNTTFDGTPLTLVVKLNRPNCLDVLRLLLEERADVGSQYYTKLGLSDSDYHGVAACAACASGNVSALKLLVQYDAPLSGRLGLLNREPNSTLLYEASYFGHAEVVEYLLQQNCDPDVQVTCHDDLKQKKTAIQTAAMLGHSEVVGALLSANVGITQDVLRASIDGGHEDILRQIVRDGADMFKPSFVLHGGSMRAIDYVFGKRNSMLVAAVAQGLWLRVAASDPVYGITEELQEELDRIMFSDVLKFLDTPDAQQILRVIFRSYQCQYRDGRRQHWKIADIPDGDLNVALGPAKEYFDERPHTANYHKTDAETAFEKSLGFDTTYGKQVPAEVFYCSFPWLHRHPEVLRIFASERNASVFEEKAARAIVRMAWSEARTRHTVSFVMDLLAALLFFCLALVLRGEHWWQDYSWHLPTIVTLLFLIWAKTLIWELLQLWGFQLNGSLMRYMRSLDNLTDLLRIILTGITLVVVSSDWNNFRRGKMWRLIFAATGFLWWLKVLNTLKGYESTGESMLPILNATFATGPFLFVVFCFIAGFWHVYYSFGFTAWWTAWMTMFRMGFLADAGLLDDANEPADWSTWVDLLLMVVGLSVAIVLLNILVGVLSESYSAGFADRTRLFLAEKCRVLSIHFALDATISWKCCRNPRIGEEIKHWAAVDAFDRLWFVSKREKSEKEKSEKLISQ